MAHDHLATSLHDHLAGAVAVAPALPDVNDLDYDTLMQRAADQRGRAEALRLQAAQAALIRRQAFADSRAPIAT
jgi:hypothetical protein